MAFALFQKAYGLAKANLRVRIVEASTATPAIIKDRSGQTLTSQGTAVLDAYGNLAVYLDQTKTFEVRFSQYLLASTPMAPSVLVTKTHAQLMAQPLPGDLELGTGATYILDTDPTTSYRISSDGTEFVNVGGSGALSPPFSSITGLPTTVAGYGITDAATMSAVNARVVTTDLNSSANGLGADLVGGVGRVVNNVTALLALSKMGVGRAFMLGYANPGDGGGGQYYYDPFDTSSLSDGGSVFVAGDGGRWKLAKTGNISVKQFGATGNGTTDDTVAIQKAAAYAQALVANRFLSGAVVYLPNGTYLISSTITINTSNVYLVGDATASSMLYAPSATFDLVVFDGTALALYSVGAMNLKTYTPGNASAGAHIRVRRAINSIFHNLHCDAWWGGIVSDGCAKTMYSNILLTQENRTAGTTCQYGFDFRSTSNNNSDVHLSNYQIIFDSTMVTCPISMAIEGSDGIYITNGHQFGSVILQPGSSGAVCSSVFWSNIYFDASTNTNVSFTGTAGTYRNFWFSNCYFRQSGGNGVQINASSPISCMMFVNCEFSSHRLYAVYAITQTDDVVISNCIFDNNNMQNSTGTGDILVCGMTSIIGNRFRGGGALGTAVILNGSATYCIVSSNAFISSTAATSISNMNPSGGNRLRANIGFATKSFGQQVLANPSTSVVVNHGLAVTPSLAVITLKFLDSGSGITRLWPSNATSTQFTINSNAAPTTSATIGWQIDTEI